MTIPQDIMAVARTVADRDVNFGSYEVNTLAIARAILAERQRCADVAEKEGQGFRGHNLPQCALGAFSVRKAILAGEPA